MKLNLSNLFFICFLSILISMTYGCYDSTELNNNMVVDIEDIPDPENEDTGLIIPEDSLIEYSEEVYNTKYSSRWAGTSHKSYVYLCAKKLGLTESRAANMRNASVMPDEHQSGIDNLYNQQWSHAYIYHSWGFWIWGDADDDFHDNIDGDSGESESPEGYNGKWAGYYYNQGDQDLGDWYVGYAAHYIGDISFVLHSSFPDYDMAVHHGDYEKWVGNNWYSGHNFYDTANAVSADSFYTITDLKAAIRKAAKNSCYSHNSNAKKAWNNYKNSGFPTASGTGNSDAVYYTKKMIIEATKWTGGAIKYALDKYDQW